MAEQNTLAAQLRWWVFLIVGLLFLPVAYLDFSSAVGAEATKARAVSTQKPALVDLAHFSADADATPSGEVNVVAQLTKGYDIGGPTVNGNHVFVLFGASDPEYSKAARGVIFANDNEVFSDWLRQNALGTGTFGPIYQMNGMTLQLTQSRPEVQATLNELELEMADNFVAMVPFLEGREAAFAPTNNNILIWPILLFGLGCLHVAYGLFKRREQGQKRAEMQVFLDHYTNGMSVPAE